MHDVERLGELLRLLPPPPAGWVQAARELPFARRTLDEIVARAEADLEFRDRLVAHLEETLADAGYEADERTLAELRAHFGSG